ncbi:SCF ubiquitin ligase subunit CulC [Coccidioides immitis RS]|uniref:Cullin-3 n=1 Tax=Coccidioides immitis H538.4 TaxID=396776 RepID=A0A0J8REC9_COCIT|nr:SCF ubiquitin ligase subunit CulC [Coccidioides immitis RS]EAS35780.3 SCF ubiquitin ligase subunit CulC [Coccidioides immitis RS]KMU83575.1 cullin-3 [Coccidioides immitis H538.4]
MSRGGTADFDTLWNVLASSMSEIHTKNASSLSFEEIYRSAYKAVMKKQGLVLYNKVIEFERTLLRDNLRKKITDLITPLLLPNTELANAMEQENERRVVGERFLSKIRDVWEDYQLCMGMIADVLMYMDKSVVAEHRSPSLYVASMCSFRDIVLRLGLEMDSQASVASVLQSTILFLIQLEREGIIIDRPLIRHCIYMLEGLYETEEEDESTKLYITSFEPAFLDSSRGFYETEGQKLLSTTDAPSFCKRAVTRIREEQERCHHTLSISTEPKIMWVIDEFLLKQNIPEIIKMEGSGVKEMLDNDRLADLAIIYDLISRIDLQKTALTQEVQARIIELGNQINKAAKEYLQGPQPTSNGGQAQSNGAKAPEEQKSPASLQTAAAIKWVDDVLQLKKRFDHVWENAFRKDQGMQASLTKSFSDFINVNPRSAEYLSLFFDENLKKGIKGKSEEEVDILLENGITLLRYIRDKDLFETYYKKHLSRRLLMKRSVSMDAERQMISKMKMEVGNTFTQRLESMFKDMAISEDLSSSYKDHISQSNGPDPKRIELEMSILTSTMWPMEIMGKDSASHAPCNFPKNIDLLKQSFESFYLGKHSGRKLTWQAGMGSADIRATWVRPNGKTERHDLNVSTYAMIILLLFNDLPASESLTFEEIQARTNIPTHDLIRNLQSLAVAPKTRVLKKDPMSKEVKPTDRFYFNEKFQSKFTKIKIGVVSSSGNKVETKDERSETEKKMNDERGGSVEAAIVRIMKQRKRLAHSQLVNEVISQLASRFVPNVDMIKKKIESLIDREYLERLPDVEPASYGYIA